MTKIITVHAILILLEFLLAISIVFYTKESIDRMYDRINVIDGWTHEVRNNIFLTNERFGIIDDKMDSILKYYE